MYVGMARGDMVGLALLLGCDYCPQGVPGVGKEGALKLLQHCNTDLPTATGDLSTVQGLHAAQKSCDLLSMFRLWRKGRLLDKKSTFEARLQR